MQRVSSDIVHRHCALFLDFDGTLADIASRPEGVVVAPGLVDTLSALRDVLDGALAVVSGRPIEQLDEFLKPLSLPSAGVHGAQRRRADGTVDHHEVQIPDEIAAMLQGLANDHPGVLVERKPGAIAVHYRMAPEFEGSCIATMERVARLAPDCMLLLGKMVAELKPTSVSKGRAIDAFLRESPFIGRTPLFAGDDTTDEAGFIAVQARGGVGIKVGGGASAAHTVIDSPRALRDWLAEALARLQGPAGTDRTPSLFPTGP